MNPLVAPFCPPPVTPFAPNAVAKPSELLLRQNVPLFLLLTVGKPFPDPGVGVLALSSPSPPVALGVEGLAP